jgi:hypothetical protein
MWTAVFFILAFLDQPAVGSSKVDSPVAIPSNEPLFDKSQDQSLSEQDSSKKGRVTSGMKKNQGKQLDSEVSSRVQVSPVPITPGGK